MNIDRYGESLMLSDRRGRLSGSFRGVVGWQAEFPLKASRRSASDATIVKSRRKAAILAEGYE
jgi:hypothetical protein